MSVIQLSVALNIIRFENNKKFNQIVIYSRQEPDKKIDLLAQTLYNTPNKPE